MAEDLSREESDYKSNRADSVGSSKSKCLSCEFSSFKSGNPGSEAVLNKLDTRGLLIISRYIYGLHQFPPACMAIAFEQALSGSPHR